MKSRAPRCTEARLRVDGLKLYGASPPDASAGVAPTSSAAAIRPLTALVAIGHPFRHGLGLVPFRVERHAQEEGVVDDRADLRERGAQRGGRLHAQVIQHDER